LIRRFDERSRPSGQCGVLFAARCVRARSCFYGEQCHHAGLFRVLSAVEGLKVAAPKPGRCGTADLAP